MREQWEGVRPRGGYSVEFLVRAVVIEKTLQENLR